MTFILWCILMAILIFGMIIFEGVILIPQLVKSLKTLKMLKEKENEE